ncbi:hypothetical protein KIN20_003928, partial [Parelaphostrongylus tenuis]
FEATSGNGAGSSAYSSLVLLIVYKSNKINKHGHWVGTVLLNTCELIERAIEKRRILFQTLPTT